MNIIFFTCIFVIEQVYQNKLSTKATGSSCSDWNRPLTALRRLPSGVPSRSVGPLRCRPSDVSLLRCSLTASRASQMCLPLKCVSPSGVSPSGVLSRPPGPLSSRPPAPSGGGKRRASPGPVSVSTGNAATAGGERAGLGWAGLLHSRSHTKEGSVPGGAEGVWGAALSAAVPGRAFPRSGGPQGRERGRRSRGV